MLANGTAMPVNDRMKWISSMECTMQDVRSVHYHCTCAVLFKHMVEYNVNLLWIWHYPLNFLRKTNFHLKHIRACDTRTHVDVVGNQAHRSLIGSISGLPNINVIRDQNMMLSINGDDGNGARFQKQKSITRDENFWYQQTSEREREEEKAFWSNVISVVHQRNEPVGILWMPSGSIR